MIKYEIKECIQKEDFENLRQGEMFYLESEDKKIKGLVLFLIGPDGKKYNFLTYDESISSDVVNINSLLSENLGFTLRKVEITV